MSKELVISANRHETRVAVLEDDQVVEVFHQRENEYSLAGSIHKGRVTRVLPGMQSAFVDIGLGRDAFLYVSDFFEDNDEYDKIVTAVEEKVLKLDRIPAPAVRRLRRLTAAPEAAEAPCRGCGGCAGRCAARRRHFRRRRAPCRSPPGFQGNRRSRRPTGSRRRPRAGSAGETAWRSGRRPARPALASRRDSGAAVEACRRPNSIRRGPKGNPGTRRRRWSAFPRRFRWRKRRTTARYFRPGADDFFVLPGESLAKYTRARRGSAGWRRVRAVDGRARPGAGRV